MERRYFEIHNWETYQKYDRNKTSPPPWIKVYTAILSDAKLALLTDSQFGQLVKIWTAACQNRNRLPFDARAVKKVAMLDDEPDLDLFLELELIDLCADCTQSVDESSTECSPRAREAGQGRAGQSQGRADARAPAPVRAHARGGPLTSIPPDLAEVPDGFWPRLDELADAPSVKQLRWLKREAEKAGLTPRECCDEIGIVTLTGSLVEDAVAVADAAKKRARASPTSSNRAEYEKAIAEIHGETTR